MLHSQHDALDDLARAHGAWGRYAAAVRTLPPSAPAHDAAASWGAVENAARSGHTAFVLDALDRAPQQLRAAGSGVALEAAARGGHAELVRALLARQPVLLLLDNDVLSSDVAGAALVAASRAGHAAVVCELASWRPALLDSVHGARALEVGAQGGHAAVARVLLAMRPALLDFASWDALKHIVKLNIPLPTRCRGEHRAQTATACALSI